MWKHWLVSVLLGRYVLTRIEETVAADGPSPRTYAGVQRDVMQADAGVASPGGRVHRSHMGAGATSAPAQSADDAMDDLSAALLDRGRQGRASVATVASGTDVGDDWSALLSEEREAELDAAAAAEEQVLWVLCLVVIAHVAGRGQKNDLPTT